MALISVSNNALQNITAVPASIPTGALVLLSTQTASSSASIEFTSGIDSTYDSYVFKFIDIHPSVDGTEFSFNLSSDNGSNYNITKTSSHFRTNHNEADTATALGYDGALHLAQSTSEQLLNENLGADNDQSTVGTLTLFNPASTTFVKHYIATINVSQLNDYTVTQFIAGYANTTSAINAIRFKMSSGNIDDGIIKMYGVK